jgi:hypothetical protein
MTCRLFPGNKIKNGSQPARKACYNSMHDAAVAQLDRVLGYEPRGRGFDSCQPHQKLESPQHLLWAFSIHDPKFHPRH